VPDAEEVPSDGDVTHSGSVVPSDGNVTHGGSAVPSDGGMTFGGAVVSGSRRREPLSEDAKVLLELMRLGGEWTVPTLSDVAQMPWPRLVDALFDLEIRHLVTRDLLGLFQARAA
jgi:hypothetical protein